MHAVDSHISDEDAPDFVPTSSQQRCKMQGVASDAVPTVIELVLNAGQQ